jgi:uncharacterized membrane protein YhhN
MSLARKIPAVAYAALSIADTVLAGTKKDSTLRAVTKAALMPTLAAATVASTSQPDKALLAAQAFSWGGDVALLKDGEPAFLAGAASFGLAHAAYSTIWRRHQGKGFLKRPTTGLIAASTLAAAPMMAIAAGKKHPALGVAVGVYSAALSLVAAQACALDEDIDSTTRGLIAAGALSFLASDTILGANMFLFETKSPVAEQAVMATYTAAQGLLAMGVRRL